MSTIYEIHDDLNALADLLAEVGGDITDADAESAIDRWLEETQEATAEKLDRYAALIREMEARSDARKAEAARLAALAAVDANAVGRLKARLLWFCEAHEIPKVETPRFRITVCANGGKAPLLLRVAPEELPAAWRTEVVTYRADSDAIRAALEAGDNLPFAELGAKGRHVRIK